MAHTWRAAPAAGCWPALRALPPPLSGAVVLFEDPERRSTSVGITVNPVKVQRIEDFGGLEVGGSSWEGL